MQSPKIEVKQLSKVFYRHFTDTLRENHGEKPRQSADDKCVLDGLSFEIGAGETVGVIGRNGAGKSTLLSILAGVSKQTSGEVNIVGKVTAVMTLGVGLREDLTGRENIYLDGQLQGKSRAEVDLLMDEMVEFSELKEFIDKPVKVYSTGMKSRLSFSMLVGIEPEILIIDEALSAGDAFFAEKASKKIKEICKKGKIVILVSHSMGTIDAMCSRCLWIEKGSILMDAEPEKVTASYLQTIREEDQSQELTYYQTRTSNTCPYANYKILDIALKLAESDCPQSIFHTHDHMTMEMTIQRIHPGPGMMHVVIERIDGLIVSEDHEDLNLCVDEEVLLPFSLQWSLNALVINKGYYQLKLEIFEKNECTNQFIHFFEVKNYHMPKGGASLLQYPAEILSTTKDSLCSDLSELITE